MRNYKSLLENLKMTENPVRRYSLSDMVSESYKLTFQCEKGTSLYKLAEAHLLDVKNHPTETDRLSKQLGTIKELKSLVESGQMKDEDLVPEKCYDEVEPKEERALGDMDEGLFKKKDPKADFQKRKEEFIKRTVSDPNYLQKRDAREKADQEERAQREFRQRNPKIAYKGLEEAEEPDLTDEELEELTKHLETIRKERKAAASQPQAPVEESKEKTLNEEDSSNFKVYQVIMDVAFPAEANPDSYGLSFGGSNSKMISALATTLRNLGLDMAGDMISIEDDLTDIYVEGEYEFFGESKNVTESRSYKGLSDFAAKSKDKAFMKTFKKMHEKLKEGNALTRQEAINLYKAANSAMTHFSVELEHNPEFITIFKECTSILSKDVESVLGSLKEGKAPSKKTMKSLAKFSEALLLEDEEEEELPPIEDEENDFISDEEGDIISEEEEDFNQEYADARVELHKELADEHGDTEDPGVQEQLAKDTEEVLNLPGITDEQIAELTGEEPEGEEEPEEDPAEEPESEETPEEEPESPEDDEDITDDELAELKRHLTEMRKAKRAREAKEICMCDADGTPWVTKKEFEKMSKAEQDRLTKTMASSDAGGVGRYRDKWQELEKEVNESLHPQAQAILGK